MSFQQKQEEAFELYMQGYSLRSIATKVLPDSKGGYVTVHRWSRRFGWKDKKAELEAALADDEHKRFLAIAAQSQETQLRISNKAFQAVELALDAYFERDKDQNVIGIKTNPKSGAPLIPAIALVQMLTAAANIQQSVLNLDALAPQEREQVAIAETKIVDADPATLAAIGDFLARQALEAPPSTD